MSKSEKPFEYFGQPSYTNGVLMPQLFENLTSSSSKVIEGGKEELPDTPTYNVVATDEEED